MSKKKGNGEGTLFFDEKHDRWLGQVVTGTKADGKPIRKTFYGKTRKEVNEKVSGVLNSLKNDTYVQKSDVTLIELAKEILADKYDANRVTARSHKRMNETIKMIERHPIARKKIQDITERQLKDFFNAHTDYANSTIEKLYMTVGQAFRKALKRKYISYNPMSDHDEVPKPKSRKADKEVRAFTLEEQNKIIHVFENEEAISPYRDVVLLGLYTGMRIGEILALDKTKDLDFINKKIRIRVTLTRDENDKVIMGTTTKTYNSKREIAIIPTVEIVLKHALLHSPISPENTLFYDAPNKTFVTPGEVSCYFKRVCKKYNIAQDVTFHMLRHTYATRCIEAGVNAKVLQKKLGHKKIETTLDTYTSVFARFEETQDERYMNYLNEHNLLLSEDNFSLSV